jgi:diguanylate cyclase (GGDEF)-like protein
MTPSASPSFPDDEDSALVELIDDDECPPSGGGSSEGFWKILVVDDDEDVHVATELALRGVAIEGRPLQFLHGHSASEARARLAEHPDVAVMLLDVVMESEDAGLRLVSEAREVLGHRALRIVLRTGQPGYAPELETIRRHDINDYRTKSELTRVRLYTSLTAAIRAYRQLSALQETRRGLETIVRASTELSKQHGLQRFAEGVIVQLCALLDIRPEGVVCAQAAWPEDHVARVIAAAGRYGDLMYQPLDEVPLPTLRGALARCLSTRSNVYEPAVTLFFSASNGRGMAAYVEAAALGTLERELLEVFCASMSVGFENVLLYSQLLDLAYHDQLLRIPNRNRFIEIIDKHLREPAGLAVAVIDLDDFAGINETLGHAVGDDLLRSVGTRLSERFGQGVVMARLGSDSFGVLGPETAVNPENLARVLAEPFDVQGERLRLSATSGLVRLSEGTPRGADLLKDANIALKRAKERHRGSAQYFVETMRTDARERMRLLRGLREAFEARRLFVAYQPQVMLADGRVTGAEALLRWRTDDGQFVPPARFIPLAEQSGLMITIGEFVLRSACHQLRRWHDLGHGGLGISVNVSQAQFRDPAFPEKVAAALRDAQVAPAHVELEITESMAAEDLEFVIDTLGRIRATGVAVAIDDFGTGFSSLSVLRQLRADRLKIDRAFVNELEAGGESVGIAKVVVELGRNLGMRVIAEGVETNPQRQALLALGCQEAQGYLYARPMAADQFEDWLRGPH